MPTKTKDESLEQFARDLTPGSVGEVPIETVTKAEFRSMQAPDPSQRFLDIARIGSMSDFILESVGMLDSALTDLLSTSNKPLSAGRKFNSFDDKIKRAFDLRLIDKEERAHLDALRVIRNAFAHDPAGFHFVHDEDVMEAYRSIPPKFQCEPFEISIRDHLSHVCCWLHFGLSKRTAPTEDTQKPGDT